MKLAGRCVEFAGTILAPPRKALLSRERAMTSNPVTLRPVEGSMPCLNTGAKVKHRSLDELGMTRRDVIISLVELKVNINIAWIQV